MAEPHKQPTTEELKIKEEEALKAAEELEGRQTIPEEEASPEEQQRATEKFEEDQREDEEQEELKNQEGINEEDIEAEPSKELYKKKFSASSRENQKIAAKNRVINKALADAEDVPEPTEEELIKEFPDWDIMGDTEKILAKETVISRTWRKVISSAKEQATKIEKWNESVEEFTNDPKVLNDNPELEGKTEEFNEFAKQETNNNVPFNILVGAFLFEHSKNGKSNKGRMFERGSGGPNDKPTPKKTTLTLEEGRRLRETNYSLWKEKLTAGLIESDL